jgi:ribosomal protein RSM22 (predicted rRNA methylase)
VQLPAALRLAIEDYLGDTALRDIERAAGQLSQHYREHKPTQAAAIDAGLRARTYLAMRFAATYAAVRCVLDLVDPPSSILDLGAGPGTAALAALDAFPGVPAITLLETDAAFRDAGRALLPQAQWLPQDFTVAPLPISDLVIAAWSLGETKSPIEAARRAWNAAQSALVIVEPGTPQSFARVREIRTSLIAEGAHLAAPCPSEQPCPMGSGDWCHFSQRVERTALHRRLKGGALPYEDEKFCYLVFTRAPRQRPAARIVRHPRIQPNLISFQLCTGSRIEERKVTRRNKDEWKAARKAMWGDAWS